MSSQMSIDEHEMQGFYDKVMFRIRNEFFVHSTDIRNINLTDQESGELVETDGMVNILASSNLASHNNKKAMHHINPNLSNGLPRKRSLFSR
jgi:hypothetical protein